MDHDHDNKPPPPRAFALPNIDWSGLRLEVANAAETLLEAGRRVGAVLDAAPSFLRDSGAHLEGEWGYLLRLVDPWTGLSVAMALEVQRRGGIQDDRVVVSALRTGLLDPTLLAEIREAVERSTLTPPARMQICAGLDHLSDKNSVLAVPLLVIAVEGAWWQLAEERGGIEQDDRGKWHAVGADGERRDKVHGVEKVVRLEGLDLTPAFVAFFTALAYGGAGNPFRHGTARDGWELRGLLLLVSLIGWLDTSGVLRADVSVRAAFDRARRERREAARADAGDARGGGIVEPAQ